MAGRPDGSPTGAPATSPYAPFRPRWGRGVARVVSIVVLVSFAFAAITVPGQEGQKGDWTIADRLLIFLSGAAIAYFLHRYATIVAVPSKDGLYVRNILRQHTLSWEEVVRVQYGGGAPWASIDLTDTDTVAVMAIQKVDGQHATAMAGRLAALIQVHGEIGEPGAQA
ncbi:MAG: PH domain-containing protein [Austwickia sp.]|jgi:hypothetical protein|nr:PH domain-containing protein [Austwickia sp.]MBK8435619.1 PH domain-containing protein [Austwickia sp.]MBK9100811.1 PH domain-containing protein [Austwickia sp.]